MKKNIGFVCFGEVNTPIERLNLKHDEGLKVIKDLGYDVLDAGLVIDDPEYKTADAAVAKIKAECPGCEVVGMAPKLTDSKAVRYIFEDIILRSESMAYH